MWLLHIMIQFLLRDLYKKENINKTEYVYVHAFI